MEWHSGKPNGRNRRALTREPSGGNAWYLYSPVGFRHHWFERQLLWCLSGGRSLWKNVQPAEGLSLPPSRDRSVFSSFYTHAPAATPQPNGRSIATEWARGRWKRENIPRLSTDALRPLVTKQQKTALFMAKFIQNQSLLLLEKL